MSIVSLNAMHLIQHNDCLCRLSLLKSKIRKSESSSSSRPTVAFHEDDSFGRDGRGTAPAAVDTMKLRQGSSLSEYIPTFSVSTDVRRNERRPSHETSSYEPTGATSIRSSIDKLSTLKSSSTTSTTTATAHKKLSPPYEREEEFAPPMLDDSDLIECPHCQRRFLEKPYQTHVRICQKVKHHLYNY
jgi:hypothetical protein